MAYLQKSYQTLTVNLDNGACWITFNRPKIYNAISFQMYIDMGEAFRGADQDENCNIIVVTGAGKYYSSGNDQKNFMDPNMEEHRYDFRNWVDMLIDLKTPVVCLVNGPAVGAAVTMLPLCDVVIASEKATFHTPFTKLGLSPEACSTVTFPSIMGTTKANELLMFNKKFTAQEMFQYGVVSQVIPEAEWTEKTRAIIKGMSQHNKKVLARVKSVMRTAERRRQLHDVNHHECGVMLAAFGSEESMAAIQRFFNRNKSKL